MMCIRWIMKHKIRMLWLTYILNIIYEETDAYFSGQKDKQDVIDIIQRRVQLYLAE